MSKEEYIGFRVSSSTKERWETEADENPEYRSLTHMICVAVKSEISDRPDKKPDSADVDLSHIHNRFDALDAVLRDIEDRVDDTYSILYRQEDNSQEIRAHVQELIPTGNREDILSRDPERYDELEETVSQTGSVSHITRLLQRISGGKYVPSDIRHAIETLEEDVAVIETTYANPGDEKDKRVYRVID